MSSYFTGFLSAVFLGGVVLRSLQTLFMAALGLGAFAEYAGWRDTINNRLGVKLVPDALPLGLIFVACLVLIIGHLGHKEAMRYWLSSRIRFGRPTVENHPLWLHGTGVQKNFVSKIALKVWNDPYKTNGGKPLGSAWVKVEVFRLDFKPVREWDHARWEENNHPPYEGSPKDHFPHIENFTSLPANRSAKTISVLFKPLTSDYVYHASWERPA